MGNLMIDFDVLKEFGPLLLSGIKITLVIALVGCLIGILLGTILGVLLSQKKGIVRWLIMAYVTVIRGTPMLIQVAATYHLLQLAGFGISALWSSIISIGLNSG